VRYCDRRRVTMHLELVLPLLVAAASTGCPSHVARVADCTIGEVGYQNGEVNPQNGCQVCLGATSPSSWSVSHDGTPCDAGQCSLGLCASPTCQIDGGTYTAGQGNSSNDCYRCEPSQTAFAWTRMPDKTLCRDAGTTACGTINVVGGGQDFRCVCSLIGSQCADGRFICCGDAMCGDAGQCCYTGYGVLDTCNADYLCCTGRCCPPSGSGQQYCMLPDGGCVP
jgi:hypothetical protein